MNNKYIPSRWPRLKELLITTTVGWLPALAMGRQFRRFLYRSIFAQMGNFVHIEDGVDFHNTLSIELGDSVCIFRGARIDARGDGNRISFDQRVYLDLGVQIGSLDHSSIEIGEHTFIGPYACINGPGDIKIGKECLIAGHTGIFANNHNFADPTLRIKDQGVTCKGIVIEDDCWLGYGVKVLDGVTIGQGSVIGAGAVVTKDIPPYSVAVGVPAHVMANRKTEQLIDAAI